MEKAKRVMAGSLAGRRARRYSRHLMPDATAFVALTAVSSISGFIDSIAGGGGLLLMPSLLFAGVPPLQALSTNKLQSTFGTATATWNYARKGLIDFRRHRLLVGMTFIGAALGVLVVQRIKADMLQLLIPLLLMSVAAYVILSPRMTDEDAHERLSIRGFAPVAGGVGFYDGFFGPGAGSFYTTSLVALRGMGLTRATALTKLLNLTSNIASVIFFAVGGKMLWALGLCMALGAMAGNYIGSHTAMRFGARIIRPLLVVLSLCLTARLLWTYFAQ